MTILAIEMKDNFKSHYSFSCIQGIVTPNQLSNVLAVPINRLRKFSLEANHFYDPFEDKKGDKTRKIDRPLGELKKIQKRICDRILNLYPLSDIAYGAVANRSIKDNAQKHVKQKVVVRLDLKDCFHSISSKKVFRCFRTQFGYSKAVAKILTNLCTYQGHIPVGGPMSSMLTNIVLDPMWRDIEKITKDAGVNTSVWVDDLILSGDEPEILISEIKKMINRQQLRISWKKLNIMRSKHRQEATGCSLNFKLGIPLRKRRLYAKNIMETDNLNYSDSVNGQLAHTYFINQKQAKQLNKLLNKKLDL